MLPINKSNIISAQPTDRSGGSNVMRKFGPCLKTTPFIIILLVVIVLGSNGCVSLFSVMSAKTTDSSGTLKSSELTGTPWPDKPTGNYQLQTSYDRSNQNLCLSIKHEVSMLQNRRTIKEITRTKTYRTGVSNDKERTDMKVTLGIIYGILGIVYGISQDEKEYQQGKDWDDEFMAEGGTIEEGAETKKSYTNAFEGAIFFTLLGIIDAELLPSSDTKYESFDKTDEFTESMPSQWQPLANTHLNLKISIRDEQKDYGSIQDVQTDKDGKVAVSLRSLKIGDNGFKGNEIDIKTDVSCQGKTFSDAVSVKGNDLFGLLAKNQGSDWQSGKADLPPRPVVLANVSSAKSGEKAIINLEVENRGKGTNYRLLARTESKESVFDGWWITFGKIAPGEKLTRTLSIPVPNDFPSNRVSVTVRFEEQNHFTPDPVNLIINIEGLPRPHLAYSYQIFDDGSGNTVGNGDGIFQKGEAVDILLGVRNTGDGVAKGVTAKIGFLSDATNLTLKNEQLTFGDCAPGESKTLRFTIFANKQCSLNLVKLGLNISETSFGVKTEDTLTIKIGEITAVKMIETSPTPLYITSEEISVRGGASADSVERFRVKKNSIIKTNGQLGDWYRVDLGENRIGWVHKNSVTLEKPKDLTPATTPQTTAVIEVIHKAPPNIAIFQPDKEVLEITEEYIKLAGLVVDDREVKDLKILIDNKPIQEGRGIAIVPKESIPKSGSQRKFEYNISLNKGTNEIKIIATDDEGLTSTKTLIVTRIEEKGEVYVLVIGIGKYEDASIRGLPFAEVDAQSVYDFYAKSPKSLAKSEHVSLLSGKQASAKGIRSAISNLRKMAKEPDTVICYYAGHGDRGTHPKKGTEYYMIPQDAEKDDLFGSAIELSDLQRLWGAIVARRKVFIADCCNSGGFAELRGEGQEGFEQGLGEGTVVMTASGKGQKALEVPELKHGLFTYFLLKGLDGEADRDNNHKISVSEMKKYIEEKVRNKARELGGAQNPVTKEETTGEIYLTK